MRKGLTTVLSWLTRSFYFRLGGSFLLIIVLLVGAIIFSIVEFNEISQSYTRLDTLGEAHESAISIKANLLEESLQVTQLVFLNQVESFARVSANIHETFDREFESYQNLKLGGPHDSNFIASFQALDTKHDQLIPRIGTALSQRQPEAALTLLNGEYTNHINSMVSLLDDQDQWFDREKQSERSDVNTATGNIQRILTIGGLAITLVALLAALGLSLLLGRSVARLKRGVLALTEGNLQARVAKPGKDEIGQVGRAFNTMAGRISQLIDDIEGKRKLGLRTSQEVNAIASQLSVAANQQSSQASEQSASLTQLTTALVELKATASQISGRAGQVANNAQDTFQNMTDLLGLSLQAYQVGELSREQVQSSLDNAHQVQGQVSEYDKILGELRTHSEQIGEVTSLIKNIADETHLLSLNATIEAAGAGEYGERFMVVAGQVKGLADAALKATRDISQIIGTVQGSIEEASQAMLQTAARVSQSVASSEVVYRSINELNQTLESMDERYKVVVSLMQGVNGEVDQITLMTQQQESSIEQVTSTMYQLDSATNETASTSRQLAMTAVQLVDLSGSLATGLAAAA